MEDLKKPFAPTLFLWLGILMCGAAVIRLWPDRGYYFLPHATRAVHPDHELLRSSGKYGLTFGAIGTLLLFVNLTYLIRKNYIHIAWLGSLRSWMAFHVFTGLVAGVMVLLHSTFLLRSALGTLAFWSMIIVLVTGLIGRFIYAHSPRSLKGSELELEQIRHNLEEYRKLLEKMGMPLDFFRLTDAPTVKGSDKGFVGALIAMAYGDLELKREQANLRKLVLTTPRLHAMAHQILPLADRYCEERQWMSRYHELRSLMGGWRFMHRWIAILLLAAVSFHIFVAFQMGNLWLTDYFKNLFHPAAAAPAKPAVSAAPVAPPLTKPQPLPVPRHKHPKKAHKKRHRTT